MRTIVCTIDPAESELVMSTVASPQFCPTPQEVVTLLRKQPPPSGIVWELAPTRHAALVDALRAVQELYPSLPQVLRVDLTNDGVRILLAALRVSATNVILSLRDYDALTGDLDTMHSVRGCGGAESAMIIARLARAIGQSSERVRSVAVAAILIGRKPTTVATLAGVLGMSAASLRRVMDAENLPEPNTLLRWVLVLHCLAQAELSGRPLKAIAAEAGYKNAESLTNRMARLCGMRMREAIKSGGFGLFLEEFARFLERHQVASGQLTTRPNEDESESSTWSGTRSCPFEQPLTLSWSDVLLPAISSRA